MADGSLTIAKMRPECLIIGDIGTFGMLANAGSEPESRFLSFNEFSMIEVEKVAAMLL